ncbi:MAG TPA: glycine cleavage system protein GcvH [Beijerinckiaceae bacterium]|jgi:glycine cleavage system H protein
MTEIRYTKDHEYVRLEGDVAAVGVSRYAQKQLGDVVFVELPQVGARFAAGEQAAVVESVKAASEVYAPVAGEVVAVNDALESAPALVNEDPLGAGWFMKMRVDARALDDLMDEPAYQAFLRTLD